MAKMIALNLRTQFVLFALMLGTLYIQMLVINPIEVDLFGPDSKGSYLFLPHGVKVLIGYVFGIIALPAMIIARFIGLYVTMGWPMTEAVYGTVAGVIAIYLPLAVMNFLFERPWHKPLVAFDQPIGQFRIFVILVVMTIFANAALHSSLFHYEASFHLPFRYLIGDTLGAVVVFLIALKYRAVIQRWCLAACPNNFSTSDAKKING